jgi:hypothetical protein
MEPRGGHSGTGANAAALSLSGAHYANIVGPVSTSAIQRRPPVPDEPQWPSRLRLTIVASYPLGWDQTGG